jgi:hypothetical protein
VDVSPVLISFAYLSRRTLTIDGLAARLTEITLPVMLTRTFSGISRRASTHA